MLHQGPFLGGQRQEPYSDPVNWIYSSRYNNCIVLLDPKGLSGLGAQPTGQS
jgi:hypothetical protein